MRSDRLIAGIEAAAQRAVTAAARETERAARAYVPVRTGALRRSIGMRSVGRFEAAVTAETAYAGAVEFGTSAVPPRPYLEPALMAGREILNRELTESVREALK